MYCWLIFLFFHFTPVYQGADIVIQDTIQDKYEASLAFLERQLKSNGSFKLSVMTLEQTFDTSRFNPEYFLNCIDILKNILISETKSSTLTGYKARDSLNYQKNFYIFSLMNNTTTIIEQNRSFSIAPFRYFFDDPFGKHDWTNMFVSKLLATHKGNCHSLAYLYKIIADEIGAKCWLSLAPGHIYIKNYSEKIGWYNTELTSGTFPTDAWVMVTGYVNQEAIKSGLYMDTLSNQQSIALCVLDLAKEYEFQTHNYYDGFILKCCDLVLQYHPVNPMALLLKAETLKKVWLKETENKYPKPTSTPLEMQNAYINLAKLGYREMPEKMYQQWLQDMITQKEKYSNPKVKSFVKQK